MPKLRPEGLPQVAGNHGAQECYWQGDQPTPYGHELTQHHPNRQPDKKAESAHRPVNYHSTSSHPKTAIHISRHGRLKRYV